MKLASCYCLVEVKVSEIESRSAMVARYHAWT
jgi:hypothetical protein